MVGGSGRPGAGRDAATRLILRMARQGTEVIPIHDNDDPIIRDRRGLGMVRAPRGAGAAGRLTRHG